MRRRSFLRISGAPQLGCSRLTRTISVLDVNRQLVRRSVWAAAAVGQADGAEVPGRRTTGFEVGLHSAMLVKALPLLLLCACASTAQLPTADQPELARTAQPIRPATASSGYHPHDLAGERRHGALETSYGRYT
jgi:hypothetical protein